MGVWLVQMLVLGFVLRSMLSLPTHLFVLGFVFFYDLYLYPLVFYALH